MAFFAASPISMTSPIWEYTSFSICTMNGGNHRPSRTRRSQRTRKAPKTATGVLNRTLKGSDQLSYRAARMRNTTRSENPKMTDGGTPSWAFFSWNEMPM